MIETWKNKNQSLRTSLGDGTDIYTRQLHKLTGYSLQGCREKIRQHLAGKISDTQLLKKKQPPKFAVVPKRQGRVVFHAEGKGWTYPQLMAHAHVTCEAMRVRINKYNNGLYTKDDVLRVKSTVLPTLATVAPKYIKRGAERGGGSWERENIGIR